MATSVALSVALAGDRGNVTKSDFDHWPCRLRYETVGQPSTVKAALAKYITGKQLAVFMGFDDFEAAPLQ